MSAQVAVAVVSWNLRELLAATLRTLEPEQRARRVETWVVDNASSDGSPEMVAADFPWVSLIASEENLGYGAAVNLVAERTGTPWIAPANQDVEVQPGAVERLLDVGGRCADAGVIAPRLVLPDGSTQHSVHPFPTIPLTLAFNLGLHRLSPALGDRLCLEGHWDGLRAREVPWSEASFLLIRRTAWDSVGGFDAAHWMYAEDLDLAWRLRAAGWKTRYEPGAVVRHAGSAASRKAFGDELTSRYMSASYAWMARRRGLGRARAVALANALGAGARMLVYTALAVPSPGRYRARRDYHRHWLRVHSVGLRPRRELMEHR